MDLKFTSCTVIFHLLVLQFVHGIGARQVIKYEDEKSILELHSMDAATAVNDPVQIDNYKKGDTKNVQAHPSSHMDPSLNVFLLLDDLKVGKTMPIYFKKSAIAASTPALSKKEADAIPFSSKELADLLQFFSFSKGSPQAEAIEETLGYCETKPMIGERRICATSLESMFDFAHNIVGSETETQIKFVSTIYLNKTTTLLQNYTIFQAPEEISASRMTACHTMPYPYVVFFCHTLPGKNRVFKVLLAAENGEMVETITVCHTDTSQWDPKHAAFRLLGIERGTSTVCHFTPEGDLVWVPSPTN